MTSGDYVVKSKIEEFEHIKEAIASLSGLNFIFGDVLSIKSLTAGEIDGYRVLAEVNDGTGIGGNGGYWNVSKSNAGTVHSYATVHDLKKDVTLAEGNVVRLLGQDQLGDGNSHLRKIISRRMGVDDVVMDNGLYGQVVPNSYGVSVQGGVGPRGKG
ncbi:MAG: hypothetical protein ACRC0G_07085 [Fusobacteriaceae bacterium]